MAYALYSPYLPAMPFPMMSDQYVAYVAAPPYTSHAGWPYDVLPATRPAPNSVPTSPPARPLGLGRGVEADPHWVPLPIHGGGGPTQDSTQRRVRALSAPLSPDGPTRPLFLDEPRAHRSRRLQPDREVVIVRAPSGRVGLAAPARRPSPALEGWLESPARSSSSPAIASPAPPSPAHRLSDGSLAAAGGVPAPNRPSVSPVREETLLLQELREENAGMKDELQRLRLEVDALYKEMACLRHAVTTSPPWVPMPFPKVESRTATPLCPDTEDTGSSVGPIGKMDAFAHPLLPADHKFTPPTPCTPPPPKAIPSTGRFHGPAGSPPCLANGGALGPGSGPATPANRGPLLSSGQLWNSGSIPAGVSRFQPFAPRSPER
eukprot:EG_transcript_15392